MCNNAYYPFNISIRKRQRYTEAVPLPFLIMVFILSEGVAYQNIEN